MAIFGRHLKQLRKAEEATRIDPPGPVNLADAPWWLIEALVRWGVLDADRSIVGDSDMDQQSMRATYGAIIERAGGTVYIFWD